MVTLRISADITEERRLIIALPDDVPTGRAELVVTVAPEKQTSQKSPRRSLADWADQHAEHWGAQIRSDDIESFTGRRF